MKKVSVKMQMQVCGGAEYSDYCFGIRDSYHKRAHNTKITGTGDTAKAAMVNYNSKLDAHKRSMPDSTHDGQRAVV